MTVDAARELGGSIERLGKAFERVWKTTRTVEDDELFSYFVVGLESSSSASAAMRGSANYARILLELRKALVVVVVEMLLLVFWDWRMLEIEWWI